MDLVECVRPCGCEMLLCLLPIHVWKGGRVDESNQPAAEAIGTLALLSSIQRKGKAAFAYGVASPAGLASPPWEGLGVTRLTLDTSASSSWVSGLIKESLIIL